MKLIMPTLLILLFTIFIMVTVIPYAFSSVIKQLKAVRALEAAGETLVIHNLHPETSNWRHLVEARLYLCHSL